MSLTIPLTLFALLVFAPHSSADENCRDWFIKSKIKKGNTCIIECSGIITDMSTFNCADQCDEFCESGSKEALLFKLSDLYPGLTPAERALASKYPKELLQAYKLSWETEELCLKEFPKADTNDASDACRHFVWAVLLTQSLKFERAQQILDAHEQEPTQPAEQKAMDLANNQRGVSFARSNPKPLPKLKFLKSFESF